MFENLPTKRYNTLVIDPPWTITLCGKSHMPRHSRPDQLPYNTLTLDDIKTLHVQELAEQGAHVYLWATNRTLRDAFDVLDAWGIRFHLCMPLVKKSGIAPARGYVFGSEYCLLGINGKPMQPFLACGKLNWLITAPKHGQHSRKPDNFYSLVETMSPSPRIDLFSRRHRQGWDTWGNELPAEAPT